MAFMLTPRFAPAYPQSPQCSPFSLCAVPRSAYPYRVSRSQPRRPQYSSFNHFFSQIDELLGEIDREAQRQARREAHRQQQQRKRALRAEFTVSQTGQGWLVVGETRGFEHNHISIEVSDEHTVRISGNTQGQPDNIQQIDAEATPVAQQLEPSIEAVDKDDMGDVSLPEPRTEAATEAKTSSVNVATLDSDTESHKSYQATVEDDFEDLGPEASSLFQASHATSTPTHSNEPKGNEKAIDECIATDAAVAVQPQAEAPAQQEQDKIEGEQRIHGSFERTFRFPQRIDGNNVGATFKDGVLRVAVPKAQMPQVRRIAIL